VGVAGHSGWGLGFEQELKLRLLAEGVRAGAEVRSAWRERFGGPLTLAEYATTGGVALVVGDDLYVNAPLVEHPEAAELVLDGDGFAVRRGRDAVPVDVVPVPAFHTGTQVDRLSGERRPHTDYGVTHTDRCRVSPIAGCAWKCKFCDLPYEFSYRKRHADNLLETIRVAVDDPLAPARHVLVSGGTPRRGKVGSSDEEWIDAVYQRIAQESPIPVDVMMPPRRDLGHPSWLAGTGVNMVSINMEISDSERARQLAPAKAVLGRDHYLEYVERAVESFGVGRVQSLIIVGAAIEPLESTLQGVRDLAERGCIPVLSPFRPDLVTPMADLPGATFDEMAAAYTATREICDRAGTGVKPGPRCVPCHHNTVTLPDGSDFYVGLEAGAHAGCRAC
jgi:hypothetical protein